MVATDFIYPDSLTLRLIEQQKLPNLTQARPCFDIFTPLDVDDYVIGWEQLDNYTGLQALRGLNGAPPRIKRPGLKRFLAQPGHYGEFAPIDETELVRRRRWGSISDPIDISDLVMQSQDQLLNRRLDRIETIIWTLLATGTFSVPSLTGAIAHTDSYTTQSFSSAVPWATSATATPLADFRSVKLKGRGFSVTFDQKAKAYMNSTTANRLYSNINAADIYGRRTAGLGTFNSPSQIAQLLMGDNLPEIVEYDGTYLDDSGTFQLFIPSGKVIVVGVRPSGVPVGNYVFTRNVNNPGMQPGAYMKVIDRGEDTVPRSIEVHDGHSGGPTLLYPSSVVVMSV